MRKLGTPKAAKGILKWTKTALSRAVSAHSVSSDRRHYRTRSHQSHVDHYDSDADSIREDEPFLERDYHRSSNEVSAQSRSTPGDLLDKYKLDKPAPMHPRNDTHDDLDDIPDERESLLRKYFGPGSASSSRRGAHMSHTTNEFLTDVRERVQNMSARQKRRLQLGCLALLALFALIVAVLVVVFLTTVFPLYHAQLASGTLPVKQLEIKRFDASSAVLLAVSLDLPASVSLAAAKFYVYRNAQYLGTLSLQSWRNGTWGDWFEYDAAALPALVQTVLVDKQWAPEQWQIKGEPVIRWTLFSRGVSVKYDIVVDWAAVFAKMKRDFAINLAAGGLEGSAAFVLDEGGGPPPQDPNAPPQDPNPPPADPNAPPADPNTPPSQPPEDPNQPPPQTPPSDPPSQPPSQPGDPSPPQPPPGDQPPSQPPAPQPPTQPPQPPQPPPADPSPPQKPHVPAFRFTTDLIFTNTYPLAITPPCVTASTVLSYQDAPVAALSSPLNLTRGHNTVRISAQTVGSVAALLADVTAGKDVDVTLKGVTLGSCHGVDFGWWRVLEKMDLVISVKKRPAAA